MTVYKAQDRQYFNTDIHDVQHSYINFRGFALIMALIIILGMYSLSYYCKLPLQHCTLLQKVSNTYTHFTIPLEKVRAI